MIVAPVTDDFEEWAAAVNVQIGMTGQVAVIEKGQPWRDWANILLMLPQILIQYTPRPEQYDDWRDWANALNRTEVY